MMAPLHSTGTENYSFSSHSSVSLMPFYCLLGYCPLEIFSEGSLLLLVITSSQFRPAIQRSLLLSFFSFLSHFPHLPTKHTTPWTRQWSITIFFSSSQPNYLLLSNFWIPFHCSINYISPRDNLISEAQDFTISWVLYNFLRNPGLSGTELGPLPAG